MKAIILRAFLAISLTIAARAHDEPTSFIDLRLSSVGIEITATASVTDLAHDLPRVEPDKLLQPEVIAAHRAEIQALLISKLKISGDGEAILLNPGTIIPIPEKRDLQISCSGTWKVAPEKLTVDALLFPYDSRHRTFVNVYSGANLLRQETLAAGSPTSTFATTRQQGNGAVFLEFVRNGVHHIAIGLDHILFVIGLLLLGGSVGQLLRIVTAFTIAHSITLALATFRILSPPASVVEPIIALSIVLVGLHALFGKRGHETRLIFAFSFGLVHGFGFGTVLQEMVLPRDAMGISLFAFNLGVELGQAAIVVAVAPLLAALRRASVPVSDRVVASGALSITAAGAFWFFQRILG